MFQERSRFINSPDLYPRPHEHQHQQYLVQPSSSQCTRRNSIDSTSQLYHYHSRVKQFETKSEQSSEPCHRDNRCFTWTSSVDFLVVFTSAYRLVVVNANACLDPLSFYFTQPRCERSNFRQAFVILILISLIVLNQFIRNRITTDLDNHLKGKKNSRPEENACIPLRRPAELSIEFADLSQSPLY